MHYLLRNAAGALIVALLAGLSPVAAEPHRSLPQELCDAKARKPLHAVLPELARLGDAELVAGLEDILKRLGSTEKEAAPWRKKAMRQLERAEAPGKPRDRVKAAKRLEAAVAKASAALDAAPPAADPAAEPGSNAAFASILLELDSTCKPAHLALGHELYQGDYLSPASLAAAKGEDAAEVAAQTAEHLEVEVTFKSPSKLKLVRNVYGESSHSVEAHGVVLHGGIDEARLERALRQGLRGLAFSHWVMTGKVEIPTIKPKRHLFFVDNEPDYDLALDVALEMKSISKKTYGEQSDTKLGGFNTRGGPYVIRWEPESMISSDVVWFNAYRILPRTIQPALFAGHTNWVALRFFGTSKPAVLYGDAEERSRQSTAKAAARTETMWRAAQSGIFGARSWIRSQLQRGEKASYSRAVVDQEGKLGGEALLIATLAAEFLHVTGEFKAVAEHKPVEGETILQTTEAALKEKIPAFDARWNAWLLGERQPLGLLQRLDRTSGADREEAKLAPELQRAIDHLEATRKKAFANVNAFVETLEVVPQLSEQAALHAAYLGVHEDQKSAWPDAHDEYPDREGFSSGGAWAGGHGVIAFCGDGVEAIDEWMGTFFHRLPLLNPGLCGTGIAVDRDVVVLDTGSLVNHYREVAWIAWPPAGAEDIPLRFVPELPNPVPGEDQSGFGYPITVQAYFGQVQEDRTLQVELFEGKSEEPVDAYFITPEKPLFNRLSPKDAYCLIPKSHLSARTEYRVKARCPETKEERSWSFKTGSGR